MNVIDLIMGSECIGEFVYEFIVLVIVMGLMFVIWFIDFFGFCWVRLFNMLWILLLIYR